MNKTRSAPTHTGPSAELRRLSQLPAADVWREFTRGRTPDPASLEGWEFRGLNHNKGTRLVGIRKFIKGFHRKGSDLYGYNVVVRQNSDDEEWIAKPSPDSPKRHGFYRVRTVDAQSRDNAHLHGLLLDYGEGGNPRFDITAGLRDYLVAVTEDVYIGAAYFALGSKRLRLPSLFILDRYQRGIGPTAD